MTLRSEPSDSVPGFSSEIPNAFSSLEEARNSMDFHWNTCIQLLTDVEDAHKIQEDMKLFEKQLEETRLKFSIVVEKWFSAFRAFMQKNGILLDRKGTQAARTLEVSQSFMAIFLEVATHGGVLTTEMIWDNFTEEFKHILELASLIIQSCDMDPESHKQQPQFSQDMAIVAPLYAIAHRCRDPVVRRKAISLLYASPRQEGVWNSILAARVAEKVMGIEEEGLGYVTCSQDVPDWARLNDMEVKFDLYGRLAVISYRRSRSVHEKTRKPRVETITW